MKNDLSLKILGKKISGPEVIAIDKIVAIFMKLNHTVWSHLLFRNRWEVMAKLFTWNHIDYLYEWSHGENGGSNVNQVCIPLALEYWENLVKKK